MINVFLLTNVFTFVLIDVNTFSIISGILFALPIVLLAMRLSCDPDKISILVLVSIFANIVFDIALLFSYSFTRINNSSLDKISPLL